MPRRQKNPRERFSFLRELVTEFQDTASVEAKEQVLANLSNFAYDPENYIHFKELNIVDLFLDNLAEENENLVEFAIGGICNLALEKNFKQYIYNRGGVQRIINCLSSEREETVLSAVATLVYLFSPQSKNDIASSPVIDCMLRFQESNNRRLSNLASVFLQDYCTAQQIDQTKHLSSLYRNSNSSASIT